MRPDDNRPEAFEDEPTRLDDAAPIGESESETAAYKSDEFLAGREAGFREGIEIAVAALKAELVRAGCTTEEVRHIVARVRAGTQASE